ncbi:hypothetical protein E2562_011238 [Oryza meyeriana var. granulata]|uniref:Uncharacterized protein n=1 Tax=Oryza meyeriana var. granulata TaxID=110450 RepID=A0A6G1DGU2_9ORYZ|nr:hypothetical protein E2562_011238 [Oryza meyeriana var. granulata]
MNLSATFRSAKIPRALPPKSGEASAAAASVSCSSGRLSAEGCEGEGGVGVVRLPHRLLPDRPHLRPAEGLGGRCDRLGPRPGGCPASYYLDTPG